MSIYDTLNPMQREAVLCIPYGGTASYSGGGRIWKDKGADSPHCLSDRRKRCKSVEYPCHHIYK